jgi:hypothetical protein
LFTENRKATEHKNKMEQFLAIHIMEGIVNMASYRMYWADSTRFDPIADVMSRNLFDTMRKFFHINDNSTMKARDDPACDKLFKGHLWTANDNPTLELMNKKKV